ncbi:MAG: hypothetical protein HOK41_02830 [Nitrospina sp.]|jgi:hypothetical protein|nr:hypothetical protein [Nitrospina sp.]MBT6716230.1 hypothetical protein [Nitrospina sp.]
MKVFTILLLIFFCGSSNVWSSSKYEKLEERIRVLEKRKTDSKPNISSTATGLSNRFNPALSVNGLFLGTYNDEGNYDSSKEVRTGVKIQELEIRMAAYVDTFLRADITLAFEGTSNFEVEEAIAEALLSKNLSFRAGKFLTPFGKHNQLHTHAYPFIDLPVVSEEILGEEGLNEIGVGASYFLPTNWFSEITFQVLEGANTNQFNGPAGSDFAYLIRQNNLWDLNEETTMELGASYVTGKNSLSPPSSFDNKTQLLGADLTFKWKPTGREAYKTWIWQTEFIGSFREQTQEGWYTSLQHQFAKTWWVQGRYSGYTIPNGINKEDKNQWSALLAWVPSEFSAVRLQYNHLNQATADENQVLLQLNFTLGSHPAHKY